MPRRDLIVTTTSRHGWGQSSRSCGRLSSATTTTPFASTGQREVVVGVVQLILSETVGVARGSQCFAFVFLAAPAAILFAACGVGNPPLIDTSGTIVHDGGSVAAPTDAAVEGQSPDASAMGDGSSLDGPFAMAPHPAWPQIPGNAMIVLQQMKLVTVASAGDPNAADFFSFGDDLIAGQWWQTVGRDYGLGTPSGSVHVTGPAITANLGSNELPSYISSAVASVPEAGANGQTMYLLYLPPGIEIVDATLGLNAGCEFYSGYHDQYDNSGDAWGVVQQCPAGEFFTDSEWTTITASHEIAEGASDPIPPNGWTLPQFNPQAPWTQTPWIEAVHGEIADLCSYTEITEGSYTYQRIWSNTAAALGGDPCVPAYPQYAYVNASAPQGWYPVSSGGSVTIPMTGFSDQATADWLIGASSWNTSGPTFQVSLTSPTSMLYEGETYFTTNNGRPFTVTVTAPSTAGSGDGMMVAVYSTPSTPSGDPYHLWFVGAYVE
jgi:hypothetical protein